MTYDFYNKQPMQMVEFNLNMLFAKNRYLVTEVLT